MKKKMENETETVAVEELCNVVYVITMLGKPSYLL